MLIDWSSTEFDPDDPDEQQMILWQGWPLQIYRHAADDPGPPTARTRTFITCLAAIATEQGTSIKSSANALVNLEEGGMLRWRTDNVMAELAGDPDQFSDT